MIPVPLCFMPVSVSDPFQASESCRLDANLLTLLMNQQDHAPARFTQLMTQLLPRPMPVDHPEKTSRCFQARTRFAVGVGSGKKTFGGLFDCLKKTAAGPKGFFSLCAGFGVSLGGIIPYRGFQLDACDTIVGGNQWKNDTGMMGFASTFAAAQTAIITGAGISYPFDTVRNRLQMQPEKPVEQHIYMGAADCLKKIAASPTRSAVSAEPWCWCSTTEPRRT